MDVASFIATVTDPNLRREIFANMDEATLNSLPPQLLAESRVLHDQMRNERQRARERMFEDALRRGPPRGMDDMDPNDRDLFNMFGAYGRGPGYHRHQDPPAHSQDLRLDVAVNAQMKELAEEAEYDETVAVLTSQMGNDEKLLEALFHILFGNESVDCDLVPCLQMLAKLKA